jgi:pimeloyl-ACP methyl ester carboxylesterase
LTTDEGSHVTTDRLLAVHTLRSGAGTPLVLLHGFPVDSRMWDDVVAFLPDDRAVLAVDLPGFGSSPPGELFADAAHVVGDDLAAATPSLATAADAVAAALAGHGVERAVVAGLSMGGYVAMALVERHPELVAGLALLDTKSTADDDAAVANRLRVAETVLAQGNVDAVRPMNLAVLGETSRSTRPQVAEAIARWIDAQSPEAVAWAQRAMAARPDRTDVLRGYAGPSLVVVGDEDALSPVEAALHLHEALVGSAFVVVRKAGHMTANENPQPVADALATLMARVDAA